MKQKNLFSEILRFGIVGCVATFIHYGIYSILKIWINYNIAYTVGYLISFFANFFMTSYFTFHKKATIKKGVGFGSAHLFNYLLQMFLLNVMVHVGINETWAPLLVFCIVIPIQFLLVRFVFKHKIQ